MSWLDKFFSAGYREIQINGVALPHETIVNLVTGATGTDNTNFARTDVTITGASLNVSGTGFVHQTAGVTDAAARAVNLASSDVTSVLGVANGGTGLAAPGAIGNVLTSNGSIWVSQAPTGASVTGSGVWHSTSGTLDAAAYVGSANQLLTTNSGATDTAWATPAGDWLGPLGTNTVVGLTGTSSTVAMHGNAITWDLGGTPTINQTAKGTDVAPSTFTVQAQGAFATATTNKTGASLVLAGGAKATGGTDGSVVIKNGSTTNATFAAAAVTLALLAGAGTRMVTADASGNLSTQSIPTGSSVTGSGVWHSTSGVLDAAASKGTGNQVLVTNSGATDTTWILLVDANISASAAITGSKIASATTSSVGVIELTNDLGGTATAPTVVALTGSSGVVMVRSTAAIAFNSNTSVAASGDLRHKNAVVTMAARNFAGGADIQLVQTNSSNYALFGDVTNAVQTHLRSNGGTVLVVGGTSVFYAQTDGSHHIAGNFMIASGLNLVIGTESPSLSSATNTILIKSGTAPTGDPSGIPADIYLYNDGGFFELRQGTSIVGGVGTPRRLWMQFTQERSTTSTTSFTQQVDWVQIAIDVGGGTLVTRYLPTYA